MNPDDAMKRISQLEEALMLMVYQYCVTDDRLEHRYMCAGEHAETLIRAGHVTRVHLLQGSSPDKENEQQA